MTNKEKAVEFFRALAAGAPLRNCTWGKSERQLWGFYALAVAAMEKDMPAKVKNNGCCPNCEKPLQGKANYCDNCGQRLLWGGENG